MEDILTPEGRFNYALDVILSHEGAYTNNPNDPGGETNFGITQKSLDAVYKQLKLPTEVKNLTKEDAAIYYRNEYWDKYHYEAINCLNIATKVFDMAVNMGPIEAHKIAQRACNLIYRFILIDGILGPKSLSAINNICIRNGESDLMHHLCIEQIAYYKNLVVKNPNLRKFLVGWIKRAEWNGYDQA